MTEDGNPVIVVKITTCVQKTGTRISKPIRIVKLSSRPLEYDTWLDISIQFTCLPVKEAQKSSSAPGTSRPTSIIDSERSLVQLFVNGQLHVSTEDSFGR